MLFSLKGLLKLVCILLALVLFALSGCNLWLASASGKAFIQERLSRKTTLQCDWEKASWTPWRGLHLQQVRICDASGEIVLTEVEEIHVSAEVSSLFNGLIDIRHVVAEKATIELMPDDVLMLMEQFSANTGDVTELSGREKGYSQSPPRLVQKGGQATGADASLNNQPSELHSGEQIPAEKRVNMESSAGPTHSGEHTLGRSQLEKYMNLLGKMECRDAAIVFRSESGSSILELEGFDLSLPNNGADGHITFDILSLYGKEWARDARFRLCQTGKRIVLKTERLECLDMSVRVTFELSPDGKFRLRVVNEQYTAQVKKDWGEWGIENGYAEGLLSGILTQPETWQGIYQMNAENVYFKHPSKQLSFDSYSSTGLLKQMVVKVDHFLLQNEETKVVGFGKMNARGSIDGGVRILSSFTEAENLSRFAGGIRVQLPFEKHRTSNDWYVSDVRVGGKLWDPHINSDSKNWLRLIDLLDRSKNFLEKEKDEED